MLKTVARIWRALVAPFLARTREREMQAEIAQHLERSVERLIQRGMSPTEATIAARREFGNVGYIAEEARRIRGAAWVDAFAGDLRFALRHFARTPLVTGTIVLVLALGIGVNAAGIAVLHSVASDPAPGIPRDDALVRLRGSQISKTLGRATQRMLADAELRGYANQRQLFTDLAVWTVTEAVVDFGGDHRGALSVDATFATPNYFDLLGVRPALGSVLPPSQPGPAEERLLVVISYALWEQQYARGTDVIGRTIRVNNVPATIIGVGPAAFRGVDRQPPALVGSEARGEIWLPIEARRIVAPRDSDAATPPDALSGYAVARLQSGVSRSDATTVLREIARASAPVPRGPGVGDPSVEVVPLLADNADPAFRDVMFLLTGLGGSLTLLVLLLTCTNVTALFVGAAMSRRREIAIRLSLGASRARIVKQLLTESVILALGGAALGLILLGQLMHVVSARFPELDIALRWESVAITLLFATGTGILFGLSPALHATRVGVSDVLKDSASTSVPARARLQRSLVVAQIALSQPLLLGFAALLFVIVQEGGEHPETTVADRILKIEFASSSHNPVLSEDARRLALTRLQVRIVNTPGIEQVVPDWNFHIATLYRVVPSEPPAPRSTNTLQVREAVTSPGYFALMGIPLQAGRDFHSGESREAVIVGSDLARELWGNANPLGRMFTRSPTGQPGIQKVVVGVVDAALVGPSRDSDSDRLRVFVAPYSPLIDQHDGALFLRSRGLAEPLVPLVRSIVQRELPNLPIRRLSTLAAIEAENRMMQLRLISAAASAGVIALLISAIGLYAVIAFGVGQRTREIGIRMAVGARQLQVIGLFMRSGLRLTAIGVAIGMPVSFLAYRMMVGSLMPIVPLEWLFLGVASTVAVVASLAVWLPARRAARVDPLVALRSE